MSDGSHHGRRNFPEKLVDNTRRVSGHGLAYVDNGASISTGLANVVSQKACTLKMVYENTETGLLTSPVWGQAGLIRAEKITITSPNPRKKQALSTPDSKKPTVKIHSTLRSPHFAVIPITCMHNITDKVTRQGVVSEVKQSTMTLRSGTHSFEPVFEAAFEPTDQDESVVIRTSNGEQSEIVWKYHDVTIGSKIANELSPLTKSFLSFQTVRKDFEFQVGQKIGMAIYRTFEVMAADVGLPSNVLSPGELRLIFGQEDRTNVYTGQIMKIAPDKQVFEHNINSFGGCAGAVIFLLDLEQHEGVSEGDYGKAIAIHVGGQQLADGTIANFAFKIKFDSSFASCVGGL